MIVALSFLFSNSLIVDETRRERASVKSVRCLHSALASEKTKTNTIYRCLNTFKRLEYLYLSTYLSVYMKKIQSRSKDRKASALGFRFVRAN